MCQKALFPDATAFFFMFFGNIIFIISFPCLPSLIFTSSPSPFLFSSLLFSSLRGLPLSLLCLCSVLLSSFLYFVLSSFSLFCVVAGCCVAVAAGAGCCVAVAVGAGAAVVSRFGAVFFRSFCSFSLSLRPLLSSCQVHSARRVACTRAGHHDDADACSNSL